VVVLKKPAQGNPAGSLRTRLPAESPPALRDRLNLSREGLLNNPTVPCCPDKQEANFHTANSNPMRISQREAPVQQTECFEGRKR